PGSAWTREVSTMRQGSLWLAAAVLVATAPAGLAQKGASPPVAIVNGEPIPRSEMDAVLKQRPPIVTPLTAAQQKALQQEIVAGLVDEVLVRQFLRKNAPPVDPAEVAKQVAALERGLSGQGRSLADYLTETKQTEAQLKASIGLMMQWNAYAAK